mgnify:CR=1
SDRTYGIIRFFRSALAENPPQQSNGIGLRHDPSPHKAPKGLPVKRWHAAHDVPAWPMRGEKLA